MHETTPRRLIGFWAAFGPGLLWAAAAIGVSHLVQSTRAGAQAGLGLAGVILVALVVKYPFFEFGPRYAAATGASLVEGYRRIGRWALWLYLAITISTSLVIQSVIILFTAFLLHYTFAVAWPLPVTGAVVLAGCAATLWIGRFPWLDRIVKVILSVLALSTVAAAVAIVGRLEPGTLAVLPPIGETAGTVSFAFLLALVGWMPSAIDISVWSSLWTLAKNEAAGGRVSVATARLDFGVGYVATGLLAFCFLVLGAGVMYRSGTAFSGAGPVFATQLVDLYSTTLGTWARPMVLAAVLTTMLSTSITVVDGFPRAIERTVHNLRRAAPAEVPSGSSVYWLSLGVLAVLTVVVLAAFVGSLTALVDFATIVSFCTAPVLGYLNLRAVTAPEVDPADRPSRPLLVLSWIGLGLLGGTAVVYVISIL
jgi:Mn2+/Fe2+ NRAMP family transporter